jgi:hypothetical protein
MSRQGKVEDALSAHGLALLDRRQIADWVALAAQDQNY